MFIYQEQRRRYQERRRIRAHSAHTPTRGQKILLRIGALCAILGPLALAASFIPLGDLPAHDAALLGKAAASGYIANHPVWLAIHVGTLVGGLLWVVALAALACTLPPGVAGTFARFVVPSAIMVGGVLIFEYGVDGYALWALANEWAAAPGPEKTQFLMMVDTARVVLNGAFRSELVLSYGLTVLLAGLAVALDGRYPVWFGTIGVVSGAAGLASGLLSYAGVNQGREDPLFFVAILPIESLWLIALGVLMWRMANRPSRTNSAAGVRTRPRG